MHLHCFGKAPAKLVSHQAFFFFMLLLPAAVGFRTEEIILHAAWGVAGIQAAPPPEPAVSVRTLRSWGNEQGRRGSPPADAAFASEPGIPSDASNGMKFALLSAECIKASKFVASSHRNLD